MSNKTHHIFTMQDILEVVTEDNITILCEDLINTLFFYVEMKKTMTEEAAKKIKTDGFDWIDDGETNFEVNINGKPLSDYESE